MKTRLLAVIVVVSMVLGGILGVYALLYDVNESDSNPNLDQWDVSYSNLQRFNSYEEIEDFIASNAELSQSYYYYNPYSNISGFKYYGGVFGGEVFARDADADGLEDSSGGDDYSQTNLQEEGVDEGDIVKNDGKYTYIVSRNRSKVFIIEVFPPDGMEILSEIEVDFAIREIYLNDDKLVVCGMNRPNYEHEWYFWPGYYYDNLESVITVYDIQDKENPEIYRTVEINGNYISSRMIGDYFYLVVTQYSNEIENESELPVRANEVYYADEYDYSYTFTTIMSVNVQNAGQEPNKQTVLMGTSTHIYVSINNIYLTYLKRMSWVEKMEKRVDQVICPVLPNNTSFTIQQIQDSDLTRSEKLREIDGVVGQYTDTLSEEEKNALSEDIEEREDAFEQNIQSEIEKTMIHRIHVKRGNVQYQASGGVPGHVLNRFSMSEYREYFRIATTTGQLWRSADSSAKNHVFVLGMDLEIVGGVTDIAPGESIYSARFMGDRGYLVTFKKVDPFFVIDLSNPQDPEILGELKIPGYSNYLHPYDENHVIGIGKDAVDMGDFAWYQGVKVSLFDVSDVNNPIEKSQLIIGDRGTDSLALSDPHAFLFSRNKNLLVIPVRLAEIDESQYPGGAPPQTHGEITWTGAYVLHISAENGIFEEGRITHDEDGSGNSNYWYYNSPYLVKRSFYIEDVLYTVSDGMIKANSLDDLDEINSLELRE